MDMKEKILKILNFNQPCFQFKAKIFNLKIAFQTNNEKILTAFQNLVNWNWLYTEEINLREFSFYIYDTKSIDLPIVFNTPGGYIHRKTIGSIEYFCNEKNEKQLFIRIYENIRFFIDLEEKLIFGALVLGEIYSEDFLSQFIIFPILDFILKQDGYFAIHSSGNVVNGKTFIFPAQKESGKSTVSLYLARKGHGFLGDETIYGKVMGKEVRLFGFPRQIKLYNDSVQFFPELNGLVKDSSNHGLTRFKIRFPVDKYFKFNFVKNTVPGNVIFLEKSRELSLTPVHGGEVARYFIPESGEFTDKSIAVKYLDFFELLIKSSHIWLLKTGSDLDMAVKKLEGLT